MKRGQKTRTALKGVERRHFDRAQLALHNQFMVGHSITAAREAIRVAFVANGGGLASAVTYVSRAPATSEWLIWCFVAFAAGIAASLGGYAFTRAHIQQLVLIGINQDKADSLHKKYSPRIAATLWTSILLFVAGCALAAAHVIQASTLPTPRDSAPTSADSRVVQVPASVSSAGGVKPPPA